MENLSVRSLLIESKVSENLSSQIERLNSLSESLKTLANNVKTVSSLTESANDTKLARTDLKECARLFKEAKKNLSEAKREDNIVSMNENLKIAYNCMNDIEDLIEDIEFSVHQVLDVLEESEDSFKKINESDSVGYEQVFFAQEHEADDILDMIDNKGEAATLEYLKQWHYPGEHMTRDNPGRGSDDRVFEKDGYILSYNPRIGYVGLEYKLDDDRR